MVGYSWPWRAGLLVGWMAATALRPAGLREREAAGMFERENQSAVKLRPGGETIGGFEREAEIGFEREKVGGFERGARSFFFLFQNPRSMANVVIVFIFKGTIKDGSLIIMKTN